ncbi:DUF5666 domain-containing protein [Acidisoma silvae]|uniref:DUF5666 domain-containing protein n=1 Tax=Acidisoma silvae TaxID=2802396 RepID=A0A964E093_9PROT|nr:DUF5666 domain-containing protein [Acidisoma silvae]MCB8876468.1 hypothetical protein [Acidisoma silvae]
MRRGLALTSMAVLLAACTGQSLDRAGPVDQLGRNWLSPAMPGTACRVPGGDGRMQLAERGIGGTGPITKPPDKPDPDSVPPPIGVAAVITGFGSVCLAGLEVDLAPSLTVTSDGVATEASALAAGDRALLIATWTGQRPQTAKVAIRHEIIGPVDSVADDGSIVVAGQTVRIAAGAWMPVALAPGRWVAVSGLPQPDGGVLASRIDAAATGTALLHGQLQRQGRGYRIGTLPVMGAGLAALSGQRVRLIGLLVDGGLEVTQATPDLLQTNPASVFGAGINHYAIQALVGAAPRGAMPFAVHMALPPGVALPSVNEPAVLGLVRSAATGLVATSVSVSPAEMGKAAGAAGPSGDGNGPGPSGGAGVNRGEGGGHAGGPGGGPGGGP